MAHSYGAIVAIVFAEVIAVSSKSRVVGGVTGLARAPADPCA